MTEQPSILFVCRNFHQMAGGIERMATLLMNQMIKRGFRVGLITWDPANAEAHYALDGTVDWMTLNLGSPLGKATWSLRLRRQVRLRRLAKKFKPDVVIAFQVGTFLAARTAMLGLGIPMIAAERNSPDLFNFVTGGDKLRWRADIALRMADCVTVQLDNYREKYSPKLRDRIVVISNPVQGLDKPAFPNEDIDPPKRILHVGRLSYQKNQLFLIRAFSLITDVNSDWILTLVGEGEKRTEVELLINELGLDEQVELIGAVTDVDDWYSKSAFLAFPSLWEGFPNALVEAFRQGLPAVGLEQTAGVNELLQHKKSGLLTAYDEPSFAAAMQTLIDDLEFRQMAGRKAQTATLSYEPEAIFEQWKTLFSKLGEKPR
ncbi:glycosyltransferase [Vibrio profundum]|uniref:glycosyltransferase n=1 Tax=Vibrio profundum TaxID=2910247 RepID=UPI003D11B428